MEKERRSSGIFEISVTVVIVLVIIQTFLEDAAVFLDFGLSIRNILMVTGFCFDLFFTIEFFIRLYNSRFEKGPAWYFLFGQGWIDLFASIPLLIASSGPQMIAFINPASGAAGAVAITGFFSMLKLVKTIRIARVLRLLRMVKIFKNIKYADSSMALRHIRKIITIAVTVLVVCIFMFSFIFEALTFTKSGELNEQRRSKILTMLDESFNARKLDTAIRNLSQVEDAHSILMIKVDGKTRYSRFTQDIYDTSFTTADYEYRKTGNIGVFFDVREENIAASRTQAKESLIFFFIVLAIIGGYLFYYSPHFVLTVTDPVNVMKKGLDEKNYNLMVKIPENYEDDEVFGLADSYNNRFLPMKDRNLVHDEHSVLEVNPDDLTKLIDT